MRPYDHHDPECNTDSWVEEAIEYAEYYRECEMFSERKHED